METFNFFVQNEMPEVKVETEDEPIFYMDYLKELETQSVKIEIDPELTNQVVEKIEVKTEPVRVPTQPQICYKCRICNKNFGSKYAFTVHVNKHAKRCTDCRLTFKSWKDLENHALFCARRYGRTVIPKRPKVAKRKTVPLPYTCQLCKRKYEEKEHLVQHQIHRCTKRYITTKWVVKI